jgi:hypothetical protein
MKKTNTVRVNGNMIFKGHKLTIGMDLGDHWSCYCVLDEAGEILLEQKVATTPEAMKQIFEKIPRSLIAMETGTHSPWVSRLLKDGKPVPVLVPFTVLSWASFWIQFRNVPSFRPCCSANCGGRNPLERYRAIHSARSFRLQ